MADARRREGRGRRTAAGLQQLDQRLRVRPFRHALDDEHGLPRKLDADAALLRLPDLPARLRDLRRLDAVALRRAARVGVEELARVLLGVPDRLLRDEHVRLTRPGEERVAVAAPALRRGARHVVRGQVLVAPEAGGPL